ncbi:uncharacterized protein TrAFT101_002567 [Trichoderma asperellum]|uniref:Uncharacterized protein n=1 Tax=Trichoderma asperellum (strain ATCC 204424 / CBS 433.97 / NBRC 101777) TaxID=1042311 RepID=A0A2T3ZGS3_TRIA4|nr:hypothetical protein M441DRAFT_55097 [Trichoderma asperellum CBS 433.97]PTB44005.1 hypothetical protein M441DRAFT_55097 [Trichoderma asperellum CBS 433.97]UKZ86742.1 hypothetical protein TrAFT101_002567 [Trichoderma asperellum]
MLFYSGTVAVNHALSWLRKNSYFAACQFSPDFANRFLAPLPRHGTAANAPLPNRRGSPATALHDGRLPCLFPLSCSAFSNTLSLARLNRTIYFLNPGDAMLARARPPQETHRQPPENQSLEGQSATHHLRP